MEEKNLRHPFPGIRRGNADSYGGNQDWLTPNWVRRCACGVVSCTDLLLYLSRNRAGCRAGLFQNAPQSGAVELADYDGWATCLRRRYIPLVPCFGVNALVLTLGLNRYFRKNRIPLRARWQISGKSLWQSLEATLSWDIPAILSIGPNFPALWGKHRVTLYRKTEDGGYRSASRVKAHFVTVTGMDEKWLRVSSWGKEYYILREEYFRYAKTHSTFLLSNLAYIKPEK